MIAPDMATMLVYVFTDAKVERALLQQILSELTDITFNAITVDSDTSTSDTLLLAQRARRVLKSPKQTVPLRRRYMRSCATLPIWWCVTVKVPANLLRST